MRRSSALVLAAMLILAVLAPPAAAAAKPSYEGHYYEVVSAYGNWLNARDAAAASSYLGSPGHLVTITSADENAFVTDLLSPVGGNGYIGINDLASEGTFQWLNGEAVSYTSWNWGEPNNDNDEDCTQSRWGGWNDTLCWYGDAAPAFVIEYDGPFDSDTDGDGIADADDADDDGDGVNDAEDAFPNDAAETTDTDGDGVGDNADAFPNDPDRTVVDTTPPATPAVSASHSSAWSADPSITATFSEVANDVVGFAVVWDDVSDTTPAQAQTQSVDDTTTASGDLATGTHYLHVRAVDAAGNWSETTHAGPFNIDLAAPGRAHVQSPEASFLARRRAINVSWSAATDVHSGIANYTLEHASTPFTPGASATGFTPAATTTDLSARLPLQLGARNCMRVISTDQAGNRAGSATRCIDVPFAATQFNESADDGWYEFQRPRFAFGAAMVTSENGATLRRAVSARQVGIRATVCRRCGDVQLRWAGETAPFAAFDMRGAWTGVPAVMMAPVFTTRTTGRLIIEVASTNRRVEIDSIIVK